MTWKIILPLTLLPLSLVAQTPSTPQSPSSTTTPNTPATTPDAAKPDTSRELQAKQQELQSVAQQIDDIQARAESADTVKTSRQNYRDTLMNEMVQAAPNMEKSIKRRAELVDELLSQPAKSEPAKETSSLSDQQTKLAELQTLSQQLQPVEQRAQQTDSVKTARKTYYDALIAEMQRIEPKTQELLAKHHDLSSAVRQLAGQNGHS